MALIANWKGGVDKVDDDQQVKEHYYVEYYEIGVPWDVWDVEPVP